jgi:hypothetical protein
LSPISKVENSENGGKTGNYLSAAVEVERLLRRAAMLDSIPFPMALTG